MQVAYQLFSGRSGIEVASFESGWIGNNSWIRGTCQFGIMPANGLLYKAPDACGCYPKTKVQGFFAYVVNDAGKLTNLRGWWDMEDMSFEQPAEG